MSTPVFVGKLLLLDHRGIEPDAIPDSVWSRANVLRGARVLHINATPFRGGVTELVRSTIPLLNDLGLVADWKTLHGDKAFFEVTTTVNNGLQRNPDNLTLYPVSLAPGIPGEAPWYIELLPRLTEVAGDRARQWLCRAHGAA